MERPGLVRFFTQRNTALIILFLVSWVVALDLLWYIPTRQSLERSASELSLQVQASASATVRATLESNLVSVENAAADIIDDPAGAQAALEHLVRRNPLVRHVVVVNRNGTILQDAGSMAAEDEVVDYSKVPGVYVALAGTANFGEVHTDPDGTPVSFVAVPVRDPDGITKVILAEVSLAGLSDSIMQYKRGSWRIYVTDNKGYEIIGTDAGASVLSRPVVQRVVVDGEVATGLDSIETYTNSAGTPMFVVGAPIPIANWSLFVERPRSDALSAVEVVTWLAFAIFVLGAFATILALTSYWRLSLLTERLRAQRGELEIKNQRLEELDKMKSEFLSIAAHQLRTPISAMKWTLESLLDSNLEPDQRSNALKANESNERMIRLVDDMLAVTRIEAGKVRYNLVPLHIEDVIDNIMLDFISQARSRKLELTYERPSSPLPYISADPERMHDILGNLIENAIRYTPEGGSITLRTIQEGTMIKISVSDSGIGIPLDQQPNIFNKFFRADNAMKVQTDGSGLGLFIAKATVERHGGQLWFESTSGKGTTFFFTIPAQQTA